MSELPYREVFVMGMYNTGICALVRELTLKYRVPIFPKANVDFHPKGAWKYYNQVSPFSHDPEVLVIVLIKDPFFWIQSLKRHPRNLRNQRMHRGDVCHKINYLEEINFNGKCYENIADLWNQSVANYLNPLKFPPKNTMLITFDEFLYKFRDIQIKLDKILQSPETPKYYQPPCYLRCQPSGVLCRDRFSAEDYYIPKNRYQGLTNLEIDFLKQELNKDLLDKLHFQTDDFIGQALTTKNLKIFNKQQERLAESSENQKPDKFRNVRSSLNMESDKTNKSRHSLSQRTDPTPTQEIKHHENDNQEPLDKVTTQADETLEYTEATILPYIIPPTNYVETQKIKILNPVLVEHLLLNHRNGPLLT